VSNMVLPSYYAGASTWEYKPVKASTPAQVRSTSSNVARYSTPAYSSGSGSFNYNDRETTVWSPVPVKSSTPVTSVPAKTAVPAATVPVASQNVTQIIKDTLASPKPITAIPGVLDTIALKPEVGNWLPPIVQSANYGRVVELWAKPQLTSYEATELMKSYGMTQSQINTHWTGALFNNPDDIQSIIMKASTSTPVASKLPSYTSTPVKESYQVPTKSITFAQEVTKSPVGVFSDQDMELFGSITPAVLNAAAKLVPVSRTITFRASVPSQTIVGATEDVYFQIDKRDEHIYRTVKKDKYGNVIYDSIGVIPSDGDPASAGGFTPEESVRMESLIAKVKATPSVPGVADVHISLQNDVPNKIYVGDPGWEQVNQSGSAPIITQLDYSAAIGAGSIAKYVLSKLTSIAVNAGSKLAASDPLDDLKWAAEHDEITDAEYKTLFDEYVSSAEYANNYSPSRVVIALADAVSQINRDGYDVIAIQFAEHAKNALKSRYPGIETDISFSKLEAAYNDALAVRAARKASEKTVEDQTVLHVQSAPLYPPKEGGSTSTLSEEEKYLITKQKLTDDLNKKHPEHQTDGVNSDLIRNFPELGITVYLGVNSYDDAIGWLDDLQHIDQGTRDPSIWERGQAILMWQAPAAGITWDNSNASQKKDKLAYILANGLNRKINPELIARYINSKIQNESDPALKVELYEYVAGGNLNTDANFKALQDPLNTAWRTITSDEGSKVIGIVSAGSLVVGGLLVAGPGGAIAGAGTGVFALSEIVNYTGMSDYRTKERLTQAGMYPPDVDSSHDYAKNDIEKVYNSLSYEEKDLTIEQIDAKKADLKKLITAERAKIEADAITLIAAGTYFDKLANLDDLETRIAGYTPKVTKTSTLTGITQEVTAEAALKQKGYEMGVGIRINVPKDVSYKLASDPTTTEDGYVTAYSSGKHVVEFYRGGVLLGSKEVAIWDSGDEPSIEVSEAEIRKWQQFTPGASQPLVKFKRTVLVPAGATLTFEGQSIPPSDQDRTIDLVANKGHQADIQITQPGKDPYIKQIYFTGATWDSLSPVLKDIFVPYSVVKPGAKVSFTGILEGSTFTLDGKPISKDELLKLQGQEGISSSVVVGVKAPGFDERLIPVYLTPGTTSNISLTPTKTTFVPAQSADAGKKGTVKFTGLVPGSEVWIDGEKVRTDGLYGFSGPVGMKKAIVVKVKTPGYEERNVTVYLDPSDPQEMSLAPTKEEFVPYKSGGGGGGGGGGSSGGGGGSDAATPGKLIFGETCRDASIWIDGTESAPVIGTPYDMASGYHSVVVKKMGFKDYTKSIYIMEGQTVTFNPTLEPGTSSLGGGTAGQGHIIFGATLEGCRLWLDAAEIAPVFAQAYELAPGYHSVKATKAGYKDILKTVYIIADQSLTFSPSLEAIGGSDTGTGTTTGTSYRVTFTTNPEGAKIMIGLYGSSVQDFTGQYTPGYVDLAPGLYYLRLYRSGYVDDVKALWVGPQSYVGDAALNAARSAGWNV
jgi:hypothetical protein